MITPNTGDVVSFKLVHPGILSDAYTNVTLDAGNVSYNVARMISPEISSQHANLYPYFKDKAGIPDDFTAYQYVIIVAEGGSLQAIGVPWIDESSYNIVDTKVCNIVINNYQIVWGSAIKDTLNNLGASYSLSTTKATNSGN